MSAEAAALMRRWHVGDYRCTLTIPCFRPGQQVQVCIEWQPKLPESLTPEELRQYQQERNKAIAELCSELGIRAAVVDL